ncbi:MAG: hypothetical protein WB995_16865 [Candidatus Acidiferrales bacterium]
MFVAHGHLRLGVRARKFEFSLDYFELRNITGVEPGLRDVVQTSGQARDFPFLLGHAAREGQAEVGFAEASSQLSLSRGDIEVGQGVFLTRQLDALLAPAADLDGLIDEKTFMRSVAQSGETNRWIGDFLRGTHARQRYGALIAGSA